jgi:Domain of unknown function (DUF2017)
MMASIRPGRRSTVRVSLEQAEGALLRDVVARMRTLIAEQDGDDQVVQRLFPRAYDSEEDERSFRELTRGELESTKVAALEAMGEKLGRSGSVVALLSAEEVEGWLTALTDVRLALGARLGVTEQAMNEPLDPEDLDASGLATLHWLGWLQESLLDAMMRVLERGG